MALVCNIPRDAIVVFSFGFVFLPFLGLYVEFLVPCRSGGGSVAMEACTALTDDPVLKRDLYHVQSDTDRFSTN